MISIPSGSQWLTLQIDNLKKLSNNEIVQMCVPVYPRNTKVKDLIVASRIDWVVEKQAYKNAAKYSVIKTTLYTIINADSEKRRKT